MPTKEELTKARDAAIDCIKEGLMCTVRFTALRGKWIFTEHSNSKIAESSGLHQELKAELSDIVISLGVAKQRWVGACSRNIMEHIELSNAQGGVYYEIEGGLFVTAHEAAKQCTHMYLGPIEDCLCRSAEEINHSTRSLFEYIKDNSSFDSESLECAVKVEWAKSVRQLVDSNSTEPELSAIQQDIMNALSENNNKRMTTEPLLKAAIGNPTSSSGKKALAELTRLSKLNNSQSGDPKGYCISDWKPNGL